MKKLILSFLTLFFLGYWGYINLNDFDPDSLRVTLFSSTYIAIALLGGIFGLTKAKYWGGFKSLLGKTIGFLSLGLILTTLGSMTLSFYFYVLDKEPSYPSIAEVFYIGGILSYILATYYLAKTVRSWQSLDAKPLVQKLMITIMPLLMVGLTFTVFIGKHNSVTGLSSSAIVTDFAYAILQAIYAVLALSVLLNSSKLYGGVLSKAVVLLLVGFLVQYAADYNYSYQLMSETWVTAGYGELLYLLAYSLIGFSIEMFNPNSPKKLEENL